MTNAVLPHAPLIHDLAVILAAAAAASLLFSRLKQPVVVGYILAGLLLACSQNSNLPTFISAQNDLKVWADLGVIFVMFHLGLEFSFRRFKALGIGVLALGLWDVFLMGAIGYICAFALGYGALPRLFIAGMVAISSTTIIMKAFEETKSQGRIFADRVTGLLIFEDLAAVLILVALGSSTTRGIAPEELAYLGLELVIVVGGWSLIAGLVVPRLMSLAGALKSNELLILVSLALCLIAAVSAARFHYSMALGAFVIGSILSETKQVSRIEHLIRPLRDVFAAVFFVSVGLMTDTNALFQNPLLTGAILFTVLFGKILVVTSGAILAGQSPRLATRIGFSMAQIGEFSFIIAALGLSLGVVDKRLQTSVVAVAILTSFLTPYLIRFSEPAGDWLERKWPKKLEERFLAHRKRIERFESGVWIPDWMKPGFPKLLANAVLIALIFGGVNRYFKPWMNDLMKELPNSGLLAAIGSFLTGLLLASPFLYGMMTSAGSHRVSSRLAIIYHWLEQRFVQGLFSKRGPRISEEDPRLEGFKDYAMKSLCVSDTSPWLGHTVQSSGFRERFGASIVVIERAGTTVDPKPEARLLPGDLLWIVGPSEGLRELTQ